MEKRLTQRLSVILICFLTITGLAACAGEAPQNSESQSDTHTQQHEQGHSHGDEGHSHGEDSGHEH